MAKAMSRRRDRAIALITTMAALVVVTMLIGAFLATRQSLIALSRVSTEQQACRDTLRSLANFCRFRLEGNDRWGLVPGDAADSVEFRDRSEVVFRLTALTQAEAAAKPEFDGLLGLAFFEGTAPRAGVTVQLAVANNLDNKEANDAVGVAAKSCALRFRANRGANSERIEVVLRKAAFFDSTVAASGEIEILADNINFSSMDPLRNQIRSKSKIILPDTPDIKFSPHTDVQTPEKGTVWAQKEIQIGEVTSGSVRDDKLREAALITGGEFLPNAPTRYSVPELKKEDLDADESKPNQWLQPVVYEFKYDTVYYKDMDGNERSRKLHLLVISEPNPNELRSDQFVEFHFAKDALLEPLDLINPQPLDHVADPLTVYMEVGSMAEHKFGTPSEDGTLEIEGGTITMQAESRDRPRVQFNAEVNYRVKALGGVPGDLEIRSVGVEATSIEFKDNDPDPDFPQEGFISVERDLVVEGFVENCGRLLAGRDVQLMPRDVTVDKLEDTNDLAVFGGRDVNIVPLFNGDEAMRADSRRYFAFRGLVYAENNFSFRSSVFVPQGREELQFNRKLFVEGALVARRGEVYIQGNESVELKYNREFLDDLMEKSFEEDQAQLEELSWRPL